MNTASDPYLYPGTSVLKNIAGLRNPEQLAAFETAKTAQRIYELQIKLVVGSFDASHLKAIHRYIFQDVYPWAGQFRTTPLGKAEQIGHRVTWFSPPQVIAREAQRIFAWLRGTDLLAGLDRIEFARGCAMLLTRLNNLHPFREGNGRTQRLFVEAIARRLGSELCFEVVSRERMVRASIEANRGDVGMMTRLFHEIFDEDRVEPLRRAIAFLDRERFDWNNTYIATTTPGEEYRGRLVGRDKDAFMMRSDDDRILVGRITDIDSRARTGDRLDFRASS